MGILDGTAAVVTGAGRGIGRGHCIHLADNGASVVVNDIDASEAQKVVDELSKHGGKACVNQADISTREGASALMKLAAPSTPWSISLGNEGNMVRGANTNG